MENTQSKPRIFLRELIKNSEDTQGLYLEEIQKEATKEGFNVGDINPALLELLKGGEIYEPKRNKFRWLG